MFVREQLDNDVRVVTAELPHTASATALVLFGAGSRFESAQQCGIAHFAEHMFFKGTERRPSAQDISAEIDSIGGEFNAFTGKEYTGYYVKCASEHLDLAIDVLADQLLHSKFDADEIEREKGVILEEMNMYRDTPTRYIGNVYDTLMYGDHPLGWDIIGTEEVIRGADRDLFQSFTNRWYTGNRCVVGLGGNIPDKAKQAASRLFDSIAPSQPGSPESLTLSHNGPRVLVHDKTSDQTHIALGLPAPGMLIDQKKRAAISVMNAVLGGGMSSRLFIEVREKRGLCYYVRSHHDAYTDVGSFMIQAGVDTERVDLAVTTIIDELWKLRAHGVPADELRKAKNFLKGRFVLGIEDSKGLIMYGAVKEAVEGNLEDPAVVLERIEAVTAEDVQAVVEEIIVRDGLNLAVLGPFPDADERFLELLQREPALAS